MALGLWMLSRFAMSGLVESNGSAFDWPVVQTPLVCCGGGVLFSFGGHEGIDAAILISTTVMMASRAQVAGRGCF